MHLLHAEGQCLLLVSPLDLGVEVLIIGVESIGVCQSQRPVNVTIHNGVALLVREFEAILF